MGRVYAVASAKGGVGKTTTTANLGASLARAGHDVVVVDADIGMANLAGMLGVTPDDATLHDVLGDRASLDAALYDGPAGLTVVPGSRELEDYRDVDPRELADVVADLRERYEYVILDTGAGLSHDTVLPLGLADEVLLVSTPYESALGDTDKTRNLVEQLDGTIAGLVITRMGPNAPDVDSLTADVDADVLGTIPDEPVVNDALVAGEPLTTYAPGSAAAGAYRTLAAELTGESVPMPPEAETPERPAVEGEASEAPDEESETALAESGAEPGETSVETGATVEEASDSVPDVETDHEAGDTGEVPEDSSATALEAEPPEPQAAEGGERDAGHEAESGGADEEPEGARADEEPESAETDEESGEIATAEDESVPADEAETEEPTEGDEEGVYSTPMVEEAEESESASAEPESADAGEAADESDGKAEAEETESEEETEKKGFFSRLFG